MRTNPIISAACGLTILAASLGGCETTHSTRLTLMNESESDVLVGITTAESESMIYDDEAIAAGRVRAFSITHAGASSPLVQVGVRPSEFVNAPPQWVEFTGGGAMLMRIQGRATDLRFIVSPDAPETDIRDLRQPDEGYRRAEPPVNPSR